MAHLSLKQLSKVFPDGTHAVDQITLEVPDGELLALVGPSGCGKTTLLRLIAGLESPTAGDIELGPRSLQGVLPRDRNVAMVFQGHALYPHLTVFGNLAFPLRLRKSPKPEIDHRVRQAAAMLGIERLLHRKPRQLSGGEQQRVALGRAVVRHPACFLMDEPLSNLDARLRDEMRTEIKALHQRLDATIVYVTHDQQEAMTLGDRVAVMRDGRILQVAPPREIYRHPIDAFVAGFLGAPPMNFLHGQLLADAGQLYFEHSGRRLAVPAWAAATLAARVGQDVVLGIRPESLSIAPTGTPPANRLDITVDLIEFVGAALHAYGSTNGDTIVARLDPAATVAIGQHHALEVDLDRAHFFAPPPHGSKQPGANLCPTHNPPPLARSRL